MKLHNRIRLAALVVAFALGAAAARASGPPTPRQQRQSLEAFERAEHLRAALQTLPEGKRRVDDFQKVIDAYNDFTQMNPTSARVPAVLVDIAELYRQMGNEFPSDSYFLESVKVYRSVADRYPKNLAARDALYAIAKIYEDNLEDPDGARKAFKFFVLMYPKSDNADEARAYLASGKVAPKPAQPPSEEELTDNSEDPATSAPAPVVVQKASEDHPADGIRMVSAVRHWVGPNYLRIVIETDGDVKFDSLRLSNPDRIVIDLQGARLGHELGARTFSVENGYLRQIRVAQFSTTVARVVLDVEKIDAYSVFSLPNPFRLVIDVQGGNTQELAKATPPPAPPHVAIPEPRKQPSVAAPLPAIPEPVAPVEASVKTVTPPQPPLLDPSKSPVIQPTVLDDSQRQPLAATLPPPDSKSKKRSKAKTEVATLTPPIQPPGPTEDGSRTLTRALGLKIGRIVIDPGHGGHDTGTLGPTGLEEKDVVLDVSLRLKKLLLENTDCEVVMTRSDDTFIPLEERTAIANEKDADLFISVHANASPDKTARGIETYFLNFTSSPDALEVAARENASSQEAVHQLQDIIKKIAMTEKIEESQDFASQVQREVYSHVAKASGAQRDRGVKKAPFVVLIGANMPSVLAEISFLTNPKDEKLLRRPDYRDKIAEALYDGITDYLKTLGEVKTVQRVAADQPTVARPK